MVEIHQIPVAAPKSFYFTIPLSLRLSGQGSSIDIRLIWVKYSACSDHSTPCVSCRSPNRSKVQSWPLYVQMHNGDILLDSCCSPCHQGMLRRSVDCLSPLKSLHHSRLSGYSWWIRCCYRRSTWSFGSYYNRNSSFLRLITSSIHLLRLRISVGCSRLRRLGMNQLLCSDLSIPSHGSHLGRRRRICAVCRSRWSRCWKIDPGQGRLVRRADQSRVGACEFRWIYEGRAPSFQRKHHAKVPFWHCNYMWCDHLLHNNGHQLEHQQRLPMEPSFNRTSWRREPQPQVSTSLESTHGNPHLLRALLENLRPTVT